MPAFRLPMRLSLALVALAALGACQQRAAPTVAEPSPIVPTPLVLPTGSGCGPEIARTRAIVASDVATGNLNKPVGERFDADLAHAAVGMRGRQVGRVSAPPGRRQGPVRLPLIEHRRRS